MTCRHGINDPACSGYVPPTTPDSSNYEIQAAEQVKCHLVLKVKYPNCKKCSFEGNKIMVFLNTNGLDALKWKVIDPHFRQPSDFKPLTEAPSPDARFPGSAIGWDDAIAYAQSK